jgi:hypothetical protein
MKMYRAVVVDLTIFVSQDFSVGERTASCPDHFPTMQRTHSVHLTGDCVRSTIASLDAGQK